MAMVNSRVKIDNIVNKVIKQPCSKRELDWFKNNREALVLSIKDDEVSMINYKRGDLFNYAPEYKGNIAKGMFDLYVKQLEKCKLLKTYSSLKQFVFDRLSEEAYCKMPKVLLTKIDNVLYDHPQWNDYPQYINQHGDVTLKNTLVAQDDSLVLTDGLNYEGYDISIAGPLQTFVGHFEEIVWGEKYQSKRLQEFDDYMKLVDMYTPYEQDFVLFMTIVCLIRRLKYEVDNPKVFKKLVKQINEMLDCIPRVNWDAKTHTEVLLEKIKPLPQIPVYVMSYKRPNNLTIRILNKVDIDYVVVTDVDQVKDYEKDCKHVIGRDAKTIGERMIKTIKYLKLHGIKKAILLEDDINIMSLRVNNGTKLSKQISRTTTDETWEDTFIKMFGLLTVKMTSDKIPVIYPMRKEFTHELQCAGAVSLRPPSVSIFGMMGIDVDAMCKVCDNIPEEFYKHQFDVAVNYYCIGQKLGCIQVPDVLIGENRQPTVIGQISYEERKKLLERSMEYFGTGDLVTLNRVRPGSTAEKLGIISSRISPKVHYNNLKLLWRTNNEFR